MARPSAAPSAEPSHCAPRPPRILPPPGERGLAAIRRSRALVKPMRWQLAVPFVGLVVVQRLVEAGKGALLTAMPPRRAARLRPPPGLGLARRLVARCSRARAVAPHGRWVCGTVQVLPGAGGAATGGHAGRPGRLAAAGQASRGLPRAVPLRCYCVPALWGAPRRHLFHLAPPLLPPLPLPRLSDVLSYVSYTQARELEQQGQQQPQAGGGGA